MKEKIVNSIKKEIEYLKTKDYWEDINSFCLYTDEDIISLSLVFNTTLYYSKKLDPNHPLTYKFMPSEWYSEAIKKEDDEIIYANFFFKDIEEELRKIQFSDHSQNDKLYNQLIEAMKYSIQSNIIPQKDSNVYLVMKSDNYDEKSILNDNKTLNSTTINHELKLFVKNEL